MWFVYILETDDGKFYTGITKDLERRFKEHKSGRGARFTRIFGCQRMLYHEKHRTRGQALSREAHIKTWSKAKKMLLIAGDLCLILFFSPIFSKLFINWNGLSLLVQAN